MAERLKAHDWKSCMLLTGHRGFESLSLHHLKIEEGGKDCELFTLSGPEGSSRSDSVLYRLSLFILNSLLSKSAFFDNNVLRYHHT
jgi:hypothetical protein